MELGILGPLTVRIDGRECVVPPGRQRVLLTMLILHAQTTVSADRLAEVVWGEEQPQHTANALQGRISQLRKTLGTKAARAVVRQRGSGYCLDVPLQAIDACRFTEACEAAQAFLAAGDAQGAAAMFDRALGLWRGPALEDVADCAWALPEIARLDELRLLAVEGRAEACLAVGAAGTLVAELEEVLAAHPLREALRGHLMVALYRSGRQADALATYEAGRVLLAEELGIDPSPMLRDLHDRILRQDDDLLAVRDGGPVLPPAIGARPDGTAVRGRVGQAAAMPLEASEAPPDEPPIRVLVVDDHAVVRRGMAAFLEQITDIAVVGQAADGAQALERVDALAADRGPPDVVLMDVLMPRMDGIIATARIRERHPDVRVVTVTSFADAEKIRGALEAGASGYVLKHAEADEVARAIRAAHRGEVQLDGQAAAELSRSLATAPAQADESPFTDREEEVLELLAEGSSNAEIADVLSISERTARSHLSSILAKLGVQSRTQAALWAARRGTEPTGAR